MTGPQLGFVHAAKFRSEVITAMLGDLTLFRVDDPVLRDSDYVGYPRVTRIGADQLRRSGPRIYLPKTGICSTQH